MGPPVVEKPHGQAESSRRRNQRVHQDCKKETQNDRDPVENNRHDQGDSRCYPLVDQNLVGFPVCLLPINTGPVVKERIERRSSHVHGKNSHDHNPGTPREKPSRRGKGGKDSQSKGRDTHNLGSQLHDSGELVQRHSFPSLFGTLPEEYPIIRGNTRVKAFSFPLIV